jgi:hypothetical protein
MGTTKHIQAVDLSVNIGLKQPSIISLVKNIQPSVQESVKIFRYNLIKLLLQLKIPLNSVNEACLHEFVQQHIGPPATYMTDRSNFATHYLPILTEEQDVLTSKMFFKKEFSLEVDSTKRYGNWYGFLLRSVDEDLNIQLRPQLYRVDRSLSERFKLAELSSLTTSLIYKILNGNHHKNFVAISGDRVSLNRCAYMQGNFEAMFPYSVFIDCHAHTLANCGKAIDDSCTHLKSFWETHVSVFARGNSAKSLWADFSGKEMVTYSNTRWFGKRDAMEWVRKNWNLYTQFYELPIHDGCKPSSSIFQMRQMICRNLWNQEIYENANNELFLIKLELAIVCDSSKKYYSACYNLEGDKQVNK